MYIYIFFSKNLTGLNQLGIDQTGLPFEIHFLQKNTQEQTLFIKGNLRIRLIWK